MSITHTTRLSLDAPAGAVDLEAWLFGLSDEEYPACAQGHHGAGTHADERGRGMVNVEWVGGHLIVQHYRFVRARASSVELYSAASRAHLMHVIPVAAAVRGTLLVTPGGPASSDFACSVDVALPRILNLVARLTLLGYFLRRHVEHEAPRFVADIQRKQRRPVEPDHLAVRSGAPASDARASRPGRHP